MEKKLTSNKNSYLRSESVLLAIRYTKKLHRTPKIVSSPDFGWKMTVGKVLSSNLDLVITLKRLSLWRVGVISLDNLRTCWYQETKLFHAVRWSQPPFWINCDSTHIQRPPPFARGHIAVR